MAEILSILTGIILGGVTGYVIGRAKAAVKKAEQDYAQNVRRVRGIMKPVRGE